MTTTGHAAPMDDERLEEIREALAPFAIEPVVALMCARELLAELTRLRALVEEDDKALVESVAESIYDAMRVHDPEGRQRPWVAGGNSFKQDDARAYARQAITYARTAPRREDGR